MNSLTKKNTTKPTRPPQGHKEEARPSLPPTKRGRTTIEEAAGVRRCEKSPLLQIPTHPSYSDNRETDGYGGPELMENAAASYRVGV